MGTRDAKGGRNSVYPPFEGMTFCPFIYLVPQFAPVDVLMLGYAGGTTAGLIRAIYGQSVPITAVDNAECEDFYGVHLVQADAQAYVADKRQQITDPESKFDVVIVDVFGPGEVDPCGFITDPEFVAGLFSIARYIIVHAKTNTPDMDAYGRALKVLALNDSRFHYFVAERIARLPIR